MRRIERVENLFMGTEVKMAGLAQKLDVDHEDDVQI